GHARIVIIRRVGRESVEAQILGAPKLIVYVDRGIELATRAPAPRVQIPRAHVRHGEAVFRIEVAVWNDILTYRTQIHVEPRITASLASRPTSPLPSGSTFTMNSMTSTFFTVKYVYLSGRRCINPAQTLFGSLKKLLRSRV